MQTLFAPFVNFVILVGALVYYTRKPTRDFVQARHSRIRNEVQRVEGQLRTAQARYDEFSAKLKAMDAEIQAIRSQTRQDAEAMKIRIVTEAKRLSAQIVTDSKSAAEHVFADFKNQLKSQLGSAILDRAEAILRQRITAEDRIRVRREFSRQVESVQ